jgi:large subunit ribosomal protein L9
MEVILLERVEKLGAIGDVVKVKDGFARNYLLPRKKALRANEANRKVFEANRAKIEEDNANRRTDAEKASKDVDGKTVQLIRQASNTGQLYGSVSARDIVDALEGQGAHVSKSQVVLDRPIKAIGVHEVKVALHPEVSVTVKVNVARSPEEADLQAQGVDVMSQMFERDDAGFTEDYDPNAEPGATAEAAAETASAQAPAEAAAEAASAEAPAEAGAEEGEAQEG